MSELTREHHIVSNLACTYCTVCHIVDPVEGEPCGGDAPSYAELRARLEEQMIRADRAEERLRDKEKCSFTGPMRDCPTHGDSKQLAAVQEEIIEVRKELERWKNGVR